MQNTKTIAALLNATEFPQGMILAPSRDGNAYFHTDDFHRACAGLPPQRFVYVKRGGRWVGAAPRSVAALRAAESVREQSVRSWQATRDMVAQCSL